MSLNALKTCAFHDLLLRPDGQYSGIVDADLFGKAGGIERGGVAVSLSEVRLRTSGTTIVDERATGDGASSGEQR